MEQHWVDTNKHILENRFYDLINFWKKPEEKDFFDRVKKILDIEINPEKIKNTREILSNIDKSLHDKFIWLYYDYLKDGFYDIILDIKDSNERIKLRAKADELIKWHILWLFVNVSFENNDFWWRDFIFETTRTALMKNFARK